VAILCINRIVVGVAVQLHAIDWNKSGRPVLRAELLEALEVVCGDVPVSEQEMSTGESTLSGTASDRASTRSVTASEQTPYRASWMASINAGSVWQCTRVNSRIFPLNKPSQQDALNARTPLGGRKWRKSPNVYSTQAAADGGLDCCSKATITSRRSEGAIDISSNSSTCTLPSRRVTGENLRSRSKRSASSPAAAHNGT